MISVTLTCTPPLPPMSESAGVRRGQRVSAIAKAWMPKAQAMRVRGHACLRRLAPGQRVVVSNQRASVRTVLELRHRFDMINQTQKIR